MKKNLKILFIQLCVLAIGCFIGEAVFGLPKWLGLVIAGLMFYLVFFIIQIKGAMSNIKDEVSSDGIAGARICGVFISAILLATVYKGNIIKNLIMDCQSYTKYRPNETTGGIFVSWRRKEELPTGA